MDPGPAAVLMLRRGWLAGAVLAGLGLLLLAGRIAAPAPSTAPGRSTVPARLARGPDLRPSCDPGGAATPSTRAPTSGPERRPPVPGLHLEPASPRPGELAAARAVGLGRALVTGANGAVAHARLFSVTYPAEHLRRARAWVVAVAGVPVGQGFCGPLGTREEVVVLDARHGRELLRYSYR